MINRDHPKLAALHLIATAIGELNDEAVYVGGAVIGLYAEPNSDDTRPTKDVDFFSGDNNTRSIRKGERNINPPRVQANT